MTVIIYTEGLLDLEKYIRQAPMQATKAARLAINQTSERDGLRLARDAMLAEVAFPGGYLNETTRAGEKRFRLKYKATDDSLEAGIVGVQTPTPLARFSGAARTAFLGGRRRRGGGGSPGIQVQVQPGSSATLKRAFFIRLRSGNVGLGVRLKPGEVLEHSVGAKLITSGPLAGVYLLYGPSVDQVFRTVAVDISPPVLEKLQTEFLRQFVRLMKNG